MGLRTVATLAAGLCGALAAGPLVAQVCPEGTVASIEVVNNSIFSGEQIDRATHFRWAYRLANTLHVRTREDLVVGAMRPVTNSHSADDVLLHLPGAVGLGVSWRPRSTLTLSADYTRSFWSGAYIRNFFTLAQCQPRLTCPPDRAPADTDDLFPLRNYPLLGGDRQSDTEEIRFGLERVLIFEGAKVPLRAGFFSDRQYFLLPDGTPPRSVGWTVGAGLVVGPLLLDAAYVRESLAYGNRALLVEDERRVGSVSERAYLSLIFRVP